MKGAGLTLYVYLVNSARYAPCVCCCHNARAAHAWQVFVGGGTNLMPTSCLPRVCPRSSYCNHRPAGFIRKEITDFESRMKPYTTFKALRRMYKALSKPQHQTAIVQAVHGGPRLQPDGSYVVHLAPAGVPFRDPPSSEAELKLVVAGVLRGLAAMHQEGACGAHG